MSSLFESVAQWREYEVRQRWRRLLLYLFDRAGCLLRRLRRPSSHFPEPQRILVLRPEHLGDLVITLPALQRLRAIFPQSWIVVLVRPEYSAWSATLRVADEVWALDVPWTRRSPLPAASRGRVPSFRACCDLAITLQGDLRTLLLARWYAPVVAGYRSGGGGFLLRISRRRDASRSMRQSHLDLIAEIEARCVARAGSVQPAPALLAASAGDHELSLPPELPRSPSPFLILHPGTGQPSKLWFADRWVEVADDCLRRGWRLVLTGSEAEAQLCHEIASALSPLVPGQVLNLAGRTSLTALSTIVSYASAVVAPDTGIIHLAWAMGIPSVALFGPNDPMQWGYRSGIHRSLVHRAPCSFCRLAQCPRADAPRVCMQAISAHEVIVQLQEVLEQKRGDKERRGGIVILPDQWPVSNATSR